MNLLQVLKKLDASDAAADVIASTRFLTLNGHKVIVASAKSGMVKEIDEVGARHSEISLKGNPLVKWKWHIRKDLVLSLPDKPEEWPAG